MYLFRLISRLGGFLTPFPFWVRKTGEKGEQLALRHFRRKGYFLVAKNQTFGHWEIDLILSNGTEVIMVEVKTRIPKTEPARITDLVSAAQKKRIRKAGQLFINQKRWYGVPCRFLIAYVLFQKEHPRKVKIMVGDL